MPRERSLTPGRRATPRTYRLPDDLFVAASALADLFHVGMLTRVGEDAIVEHLIELGHLPATKKAAAMPTAATATSDAAVLAGLDDIRELLEAMHGRLRSTSTSRFALRQSTRKQLLAAFARWPHVPPFKAPRPEHHAHEQHPIKLFIHPRTQVALDEWVDALHTQIPGASPSKAVHIALRAKCERVGLDPVEQWRTKAVFTTPAFTRLPHPDATWDTRSLEERATAITMSMVVLGDATVKHGLGTQVLPRDLLDSVERVAGALETTDLEE